MSARSAEPALRSRSSQGACHRDQDQTRTRPVARRGLYAWTRSLVALVRVGRCAEIDADQLIEARGNAEGCHARDERARLADPLPVAAPKRSTRLPTTGGGEKVRWQTIDLQCQT